jgi:hypothetical protein
MRFDESYKGTIKDIDVGITLSSLMGIPASFANLGQIIFDTYPKYREGENYKSCRDLLE